MFSKPILSQFEYLTFNTYFFSEIDLNSIYYEIDKEVDSDIAYLSSQTGEVRYFKKYLRNQIPLTGCCFIEISENETHVYAVLRHRFGVIGQIFNYAK